MDSIEGTCYMLIPDLYLNEAQPAMPTSLPAHENIDEFQWLLLMPTRKSYPEEPKNRSDHVLQLSHSEIRARTAPTPVPERRPVQMHFVRRIKPSLWLPAFGLRKYRG